MERTSIRGEVAELGLVPLLRSLASLQRTGRLALETAGEVVFERGRIVAVRSDDARGLSGLARLCQMPPPGAFSYLEPEQPLERDADLHQLHGDDLLAGLELLGWAAPVLPAIPVARADEAGAAESLELDRLALRVLVETRRGYTVAELIHKHGLTRSLRALAELRALDLIEFVQPRVAALAQPKVAAPEAAPKARLTISARVARVLVVLAGLAVLTRGLVQTFHIEGSSMEPSFASGQRLAVERLAYVVNRPQRGEVVVFHAPTAPGEEFIKRVIGLPGERVLVRNGQVFVNGEPLNEPYVRYPADYLYPPDGEARVVPPESYFVLGDNRPVSFDSHAGWLVRAEQLVGRAAVSIWPPASWRFIDVG